MSFGRVVLLAFALVSAAPATGFAKPSTRITKLSPISGEVTPPTRAPDPTTTVVVTHSRRWGLFAGGLTLFAVGWAADMGASYGLQNPNAWHSVIPLFGPLIQMGDKWSLNMTPPASGNPMIDAQVNQQVTQVNQTIQTAAYAVLAIDFVLQATGVVMAIVGATTKQTNLSYDRSPPPLGRSTVTWQATPQGIALRF
jgi:hypothetical protein